MGHYDNIRNIYFLGIGGIGMSALARYFHAQGKHVAGYDRTETALVRQLKEEGIAVIHSDAVEALPAPFLEDQGSLVIFTPAIPKNHPQYLHFIADSYPMEKRAVVLGNLSRGRYTMAVAGTHGKTTTSALLAHLLKGSGVAITAFVGGIMENYGSNLILEGDEVLVVEADEFDRSFLQLSPDLAAITSMDADHLDIYRDDSRVKDSFKDFAARVSGEGALFYAKGLGLEGLSVAVEEPADYSAINLRIEEGRYHFDLKALEDIHGGFQLGMPGKHNLLNAVTALAMALHYGIAPNALQKALAEFKGVRRRFSYKIRTANRVLIDDYAHHPAEIRAVHQAIREMHPGKRILAVFQPHLFSRTRDFAEDFAQSLAQFDELLLLDIYPARETPIPGISSSWLLERIPHARKQLVAKSSLAGEIKSRDPEVVVLLGAGDIGEEVEKITKELEGEN